MPVHTQKEIVAVQYNKIAAMIVIFIKTPIYTKMSPHSEGGEPWWISAGALQYLYKYTEYKPYICEHISEYLIEKFKDRGHLRPLAEAPPTGTWDEPVERDQV